MGMVAFTYAVDFPRVCGSPEIPRPEFPPHCLAHVSQIQGLYKLVLGIQRHTSVL